MSNTFIEEDNALDSFNYLIDKSELEDDEDEDALEEDQEDALEELDEDDEWLSLD